MIPKPNKPFSIENLRPISLTSCVGKLFEHMVHNRLTPYLEDKRYFPNTMFGFRQHLSTQDIFLLLKEDLIDHLSTKSKSSIVAIDIKGAFDNVSHDAILCNLEHLDCGSRIYNYVRNFLTHRTATVGVYNLRSDTFRLPSRGTPQGSVISPLLFNVALIKLPSLLDAIPDLRHAFYADDITLWTRASNTGTQEMRLQEAIDTIERYLQKCGLRCAPEKSEHLILKSRTRGRPAAYNEPDPSVTLNGKPIPKVETLRVLGLHIHKDGSGAAILPRLQRTLSQLTHLVRRIVNRRSGLKEQDTLRVMQALLSSRITYGTPYLALKNAEVEKLNILIRKATKIALGLPFTASTAKLLKMGVHNTWQELAEAHKASQLERLKLSPTGRSVLQRLNYGETFVADTDTDRKERIPPNIRESLCIARIPRNMHPTHHKQRRQARVKVLRRNHSHDPDARYTDAAKYPDRNAYALSVVDSRGVELASATVHARNPETAEEAAIALATTTCLDAAVVFTDSQAAMRNYIKGRVSVQALKILKRRSTPMPYTCVTWVPGHEGLEGNEAAHAAARDHAFRAIPSHSPHAGTASAEAESVPITYSAILQHQRLERREYPPPHSKLNKEDSTILRRLQSNTYTHGILMHRVYPTLHDYLCPICGVPDTLAHMILACPCNIQTDTTPSPNACNAAPENEDLLETWEAKLASEDLDQQRRLVARAKEAAKARGFLE